MRRWSALLALLVVGATLAISTPGPVSAAPTERFNLKWGFRGDDPGRFSFPLGMATDSAGLIYVAYQPNDRIQVFDRNGVFVRQAESRRLR